MGEKVVFFNFVSDDRYEAVGTPKCLNSFRHFHPDIDFITYRQKDINEVFRTNHVNFFNAKPTFAKLLTNKYDLVVNIDADTVVLDRLDSVLADDYNVGAAWNYNDYENRVVGNVKEDMFLQAGLVGSRDKKFWDIWEYENREADKYVCKENDILSLIWYNDPYLQTLNMKIYDKDNPDYYGCKSLNREKEFFMKDGKVCCRDGIVKAYHHAKGCNALPKLRYETMGFSQEVVNFMNEVSR